MCYLARRREEHFVIKGHWILGDEGSMKNEMEVLGRVKGIPGVPELVDFCIVRSEKTSACRYSQLPSTQRSHRTHVRLLIKPRARSLFMFKTKHELIQVLRDVVCGESVISIHTSLLMFPLVQEQAVLEQNVLHLDPCLFNVVIEDRDGSGRGILIDWEFAVTRGPDDQCEIGGTVSIV
jgi:hypothetical protein